MASLHIVQLRPQACVHIITLAMARVVQHSQELMLQTVHASLLLLVHQPLALTQMVAQPVTRITPTKQRVLQSQELMLLAPLAS